MYKELREVWDQLTSQGPFEITETNIRGIPTRTYKDAPCSLRDVWLSSAAFAEREYLVYEDERWTYADAHRDVAAIACWFQQQGIGKGDHVAIAMRNYPEWLLIYWACVCSGITVIGMNAWWVEDEMRYGLEDSKPRLLICDQERLERFNAIRQHFSGLTAVGARLTEPAEDVIPFSDLLAEKGPLPDVQIDTDDDVCIFYTSGTTGYPKGAIQTHRSCVTNIMNMAFWGQAMPLALARAKGINPPDPAQAPIRATLVNTPLFHVTANNCGTHATTRTGGKLVLMYRWDALAALKLIEQEKITSVGGVPTMARELISHPDYDKYDTSTLIAVSGGGAQLQPDLVGKINNAVRNARPGTGYGMTETSGIITSIGGDYFIDRPDSCGRPMPAFEAKVVDADGHALPTGEVGELWVKGGAVIRGYHNKPEATAETITDGWLHTGDVARMDEDGFIYIVDRVKDMVLRGGENIYCAEVESVIFAIDGVAECSAFGVPDDRLGEEVGAAIVLRPGAEMTAAEIREICFSRMAKHKVPRYIWLLADPLPRNANGKFMKRELRDRLALEDAA